MSIIKINKGIGEFECEVFNPEDESIGWLHTEDEFNDLRVQIAENNVDGYYLICYNYNAHGDFVFNIDKNGKSDDWDNIFFEHNTNCMSKLIQMSYNDRISK